MGGGLSGLICAKRLCASGKVKKIIVCESRDRLGGRMYSSDSIDLGPTWTWHTDKHLRALLGEMGVELEEQADEGIALNQLESGTVQPAGEGIGPAGEGACRMRGSTRSFLEKLNTHLVNRGVEVKIRHRVVSIKEEGHCVVAGVVSCDEGSTCREMEADAVVLAMPSRLVAATIAFTPDLPMDRKMTMLSTPM